MRAPIPIVTSFVCSLLSLSACASESNEAVDEDGPSAPEDPVDPVPDGPVEPEPEPAECGNGIVEGDEVCDGAALDGMSCESLGYASGELHCRLDCQGLQTRDCDLVSSAVEVTAADLDLPIPDNAYDGSLASMACVDLVVPGALAYGHSSDPNIEIAIDHPWVGDLVIKLVAPSGRVKTYLHRAGRAETLDDGAGDGGAAADLSADYPITLSRNGVGSEIMGRGLADDQVVCKDDGACQFRPFGTPISDVSSFERFTGTWQVCVGDAGQGDEGSIAWVVMRAFSLTSSPGERYGYGTSTVPAPDGTYDGTLASMSCSKASVQGEDGELIAFEARLMMDHPRASQLTVVLVSPEGRAVALASRPTIDEAPDGSASVPGGYGALRATEDILLSTGFDYDLPSAENLGTLVGCGEGFCSYAADAGGSSFDDPATLIGGRIVGDWQLCVGDSVPGSPGGNYWAFTLALAATL